jgi:hypothetical protein
MRARQTSRHALIVGCLLSTAPTFAADTPAPSKAVAAKEPANPVSAPIAPATPAEAQREKEATEARIKGLESLEAKEKPAAKPLLELLIARRALLDDWFTAVGKRDEAEKPKRSPESEAAELKAELEKTHALLDQSSKSPDSVLPEVFRAIDKEKAVDARRSEAGLAEMKEAIDSARVELKDQSAEFESLRSKGSQALAAEITGFRLERDKVFQGLAALNARRGERRAELASVASGEARELAGERIVNLDWQARVESERLAGLEARIALDTRRIDLVTLQVQAKGARFRLVRQLAERMEARYAAVAERQRVVLKQAVDKEVTRAAHLVDPLERRRAQRTAQLLELESQVVAYEKAYATNSGVTIQEQTSLKDKTVTDFEELKKLLDDGSVSPLDALRLKNDFRRIGPERAQIVRTDLAESEAELTTYENALTDAEIDLVNDNRDDRFDRESLLEQLPANRRAEAETMLEELETRYKGVLNRRRNVLQNLARRAEETHGCVLKRIKTLDEQYAFIRTHIFWIRDAEPIGATTLVHARDDSIRTAKALVHLAMEAVDRSLWTRPAPDFVLALIALIVTPVPLLLGRRALDRQGILATDVGRSG